VRPIAALREIASALAMRARDRSITSRVAATASAISRCETMACSCLAIVEAQALCIPSNFIFGWDWRRRLEDTVSFFFNKFLPLFRRTVQQQCGVDPLQDFIPMGTVWAAWWSA
jgi:hypothetical protein